LPNQFGGYDQTAEELAALIYQFVQNGWLNIVGGCCSTTPPHIEAIANAIKGMLPRQKPGIKSTIHQNIITDKATKELIEKWHTQENTESRPTFSLKELMRIVSKVEDEKPF
jgi:hypothetical protein